MLPLSTILAMRRLFFGFLLFSSSFLHSHSGKGSTIVCIHGFLGARWTMYYMEKHFEAEDWEVVNWGYSSQNKKIEGHAEDLILQIEEIASQKPGCPIHFVAHSLGCLVLRAALNDPACPEEAKIGKAVLMAPPNQGSCWGRFLAQFGFTKKMAKEQSGRQLLTEKDFNHLGQFPSSVKVLVIAGNWGFNPFIQGENDGTLAVEETVLSTPHEHRVINTGHKTMIFNKEAFTLANQFLHE